MTASQTKRYQTGGNTGCIVGLPCRHNYNESSGTTFSQTVTKVQILNSIRMTDNESSELETMFKN